MPFLSRWTLQRKLVALSLCILLPLVLFGYYLVQENVTRTKRQILSSSAATAEIVAYQIDDFVRSTQKLLQTLAKMEAVRDRLAWETSLLLMNAVVLHEDYKIIFATKEDGSIFATGITEGMLYDNVASSEYLANAIVREEVTVSGRLPSRIGDGPVVNIVVPLRDDTEQVVGAVGAGVSLTNLQRRLASSQIRSQGATVMLFDETDTALVQPDQQYARKATWLDTLPSVRAGARTTNRGTIEYADPYDGKTYLAAYARAVAANWTVVVAYPADLAYSPVQEAALRGLTGLTVSATIALLTALFFTAKFTHPIGELSKKTKAVIDGFSGGQSEPKGRDEVQQLALAIDVMSSNLTRHADELARTRREIEEKVQQLRDLSTKAVQVQEEERKRLALDVHDGVAQLISGALFQAQAIEECIASDPAAAMRRLRAAEKLLDQAVAEVKRVMVELRPTKLEGGLLGAVQRILNSLQETFGVQCQLSVVGASRDLSADVEAATYRIVQEALNNVRKHAEASRVDVTIRYEPSLLRIMVEDNGRGFEPEEALASSSGLGLLGMSERARSLGAVLNISSRPGRGTLISLEVPTEVRESVAVPSPRADATGLNA